jgi:Fur family ferric uptake transcriptional regulator
MSNYATKPEKKLETLREKGHRITNQRKQLLSFFYELKEDEHLSAEELHKKLAEKNIKISLATLYRSLKFLAENGFLRELDFGETHKHYELNTPNKSHFHIICNKCGLTADFNDKELEKYIKKAISRQKNIEAVNYEFKIFGTCEKCK